MKRILFCKLITVFILISLLPFVAKSEELTNNDVTLSYVLLNDGSIKISGVTNNINNQIILTIDDSTSVIIDARQNLAINQYAKKYVKVDYKNGVFYLWKAIVQKELPETVHINEKISSDKAEDVIENEDSGESIQLTSVKPRVYRKSNKIADNYLEIMNGDDFFGIEAVDNYIKKTDSYVDAFFASSNKSQFIIDYDLASYLQSSYEEIIRKRAEIPELAQKIVAASSSAAISNHDIVIKYVVETLNNRLRNREDAYERLNDAVTGLFDGQQHEPISDGEFINFVIVGIIFSALIIWLIIAFSKRKKSSKKIKSESIPSSDDSNPAIVVRRRTTSILKKQSLEDVIGNPAYKLIESSEFTQDSAVKRIFIKNTCVKDIYNLYAEDLRNADKPKEDGCMVLGRWVYDEETHTYDISMETVVLPGDDAVFKEYELNFGGKIKLRIAEKLRKLRKDTNLQYDLTCWIHSHPGLGVFFSNSDSNVQMQLKHSQHPNFLIAFVVDILTSEQEFGIFTFRKDGSINSKTDLIKKYSLEEMYKWALESDRQSFVPENYFDVLGKAKVKSALCHGIGLNNNAIIDLTQITVEFNPGLVGWAIGFISESMQGKEYVISAIVKDSEKPTAGILGCLVSITHMSLPTIQRIVASECPNISFILVYSYKLMTLTSIPVINGEVVTDESYYGDVNIDELKIWTRRKR